MSEEAVLSAVKKLHSTGTSGGPNFTPAVRSRGWNEALKAVAVELDAASPENVDVLFKRLDREHEEKTLAEVNRYNAERRAEKAVNSGERVRSSLTDLERQVVLGIAEGLPYDEVASANGFDVKTVDNALQRARRKLSAALEAA